jgi:glycosyltransferase involved in cell wall biosynthesis
MRKDQVYIANVSTFPPRRCGIGSFAKDMIEGIISDPKTRVGEWIAYPIVREPGKTVYPPRYRMHIGQEIHQEDPKSYENAAKKIVGLAKELRDQGTDIGVFLNHEYGIFAEHHTRDNAVRFLDTLNQGDVASIVVGHTVLTDTSKEDWPQKRNVMVEMIERADKFICITPYARRALMNPSLYYLQKDGQKHTVSRGKLIEVSHGIPEIDIEEDREDLKKEYGFVRPDGTPKKLFTSAGFLSPSKGLEYVLEGYAKVLKEREDRNGVTYLIAGGTHEEVLRHEGENYRNSLIELAKRENIKGAVITREGNRETITDLYANPLSDITNANLVFLNTHLSDKELIRVMKMSDFGVIGNLGEEQISSGPGTYWIGMGRITIATESPFFKDMEDQGIGLLVPFRDSLAYYDRMNHVLDLSQADKEELEYIASDFGSANTWTINGLKYLNVMLKIIKHKAGKRN